MTKFKNAWTEHLEYLESINAALRDNVEENREIINNLINDNMFLSQQIAGFLRRGEVRR
jgi:hypothetical protein